jgi:hypothetical protein
MPLRYLEYNGDDREARLVTGTLYYSVIKVQQVLVCGLCLCFDSLFSQLLNKLFSHREERRTRERRSGKELPTVAYLVRYCTIMRRSTDSQYQIEK